MFVSLPVPFWLIKVTLFLATSRDRWEFTQFTHPGKIPTLRWKQMHSATPRQRGLLLS